MPTRHEVKCWPEFYSAIKSGEKTFDLRNDDRKYAVGDTLVLKEFDDRLGKFTNEKIERIITYKLAGIGSGGITPLHGLLRGFCILALKDVGP